MQLTDTTGTSTLNKYVRRAGVSVVPERTIDESAVLREGGCFADSTPLLAEPLGGEKTPVSRAIDKNGTGYGV